MILVKHTKGSYTFLGSHTRIVYDFFGSTLGSYWDIKYEQNEIIYDPA